MFLKDYFEKNNFEKKNNEEHENLPSMQMVKGFTCGLYGFCSAGCLVICQYFRQKISCGYMKEPLFETAL